ncbi:MAG: hypothetical protein IM600_10565 [Bacteroidetes bacterium]|nr:hypothetical protein [Bacteroidota bacterium]MCA6443860.1 hypothetical protein [Bacteroidota bacterium]
MKKISFIIVFLSGLILNAQKLAEVSLDLLDGNQIKGTTTLNDVELITSYGKLSIPITKINSVKIGYGKDASSGDKAKGYCKILAGAGAEDTRKAAYSDLVKLGAKSIYAIEEFLNDPKTEISEDLQGDYSIDNALAEIKSNAGIGSDAGYDDVIMIDNQYNMGGIYTFTKLDVKTEYGNLTVPKEKIKSIEVFIPSPGGKDASAFKLNANKHISGNNNGGWLKTGIMVKAGQKITITATGEITLASLSNNKYKPDGSSKAASASSWTPPYASEASEDSEGYSYPSYGQIVFKVGETGEMKKANVKGTNKAKTSGLLFISIYETVYNAANSGSYQVNIKLN